jgi:hypothetical protein
MIVPGVQLHRLYSLNVTEHIRILFEDLHSIDIHTLRATIRERNYAHIPIVKDGLYINTVSKIISLVGYPLSDNLYMVTKELQGSTIHISYECPAQQIIDAVGYLSHMYENVVDG